MYPLMEFDSFMKHRGAKPVDIRKKTDTPKNEDVQRFHSSRSVGKPDPGSPRMLPRLRDLKQGGGYDTGTSFATDINRRFSPTTTLTNR